MIILALWESKQNTESLLVKSLLYFMYFIYDNEDFRF